MPKGKKDETVEISDKREHPYFLVDNALIENHGSKIGVFGLAVYNVLAMYAGRSGSAYPSYQKIADLLGISRGKVIDAIRLLIAEGVIRKESRFSSRGDKTSNLYILLKQSEWGGSPQEPGGSTQHEPPGSPQEPPSTPGESPPSTPHEPGGSPGVLDLLRMNNNKLLEQELTEKTENERTNESPRASRPENAFIHSSDPSQPVSVATLPIPEPEAQPSPSQYEIDLEDCIDLLMDDAVGLCAADARRMAETCKADFDFLARQVFAWLDNRTKRGARYTDTKGLMTRIERRFSAPEPSRDQKRSALYKRFYGDGYSLYTNSNRPDKYADIILG